MSLIDVLRPAVLPKRLVVVRSGGLGLGIVYRKLNVDYVSASFPRAANGGAMTRQATDGFVRVIALRDNHLIVGRRSGVAYWSWLVRYRSRLKWRVWKTSTT